MHKINRFELKNGLRVLHMKDPSRSTIVLNTLYNVGARDEDASRTGFAHLFEHLMFSGSKHVPIFDKEVEEAGGQNNAFTNNDFTNYYLVMPKENIETAFWLESDRMKDLTINEESLGVQKGVVVEEFKQRCFNSPFGMLWHHVREACYTESSYRWPTIGLVTEHISESTLKDVQDFYNKFYKPQNAILSIVGDIELTEAKSLTEKWFGDIEKEGERNPNQYLNEAAFSETLTSKHEDLSPNNAVFIVWKGPSARDAKEALCLELFGELLGGSEISPLQMKLVKGGQDFNGAEGFYLKGIDEGLFILYGILNEEISHEDAVNQLIETLTETAIVSEANQYRLESIINRLTTQQLIEATQPMQLAQKLCYYENLGDVNFINEELPLIESLTLDEIIRVVKNYLVTAHSRIIHYSPKQA